MKEIQKKKQNKGLPMKAGTYGILILVIVVFIGGPLVTIFLQNDNYAEFGSYAGKPILYDPSNYFGRSTQAQLDTIQSRIGNNTPINSNLEKLAIENAFDQTVETFALLDLANKNKYIVSDTKINKKISEHPDLQDDNDNFDIELYRSIPKEDRLKNLEIQRQFELSSIIRNDLIETEYLSTSEQEFLSRHNENKIRLNYVVFNHSEIKDKRILRSFAENNPELFKEYSFQSLTVSDETEAQTIKMRIENDESTFIEEVQSYSIDEGKEDDGDRGSLYAYQIENNEGKESLEAIQALTDKETISDIVRTSTGNFAFYRKTKDVRIPRFQKEEELDIVQNYINEFDPNYAEEKIKERADEFIQEATKDGFFATATRFDLETYDSKDFPLNIGSESVYDSIENDSENTEPLFFINNEEELLTNLFSLEEKTIPDSFTRNNNTYVFFILSITKPKDDVTATEQDTNRITTFLRNHNQETLNATVVQEKKLKNNFNTTYTKVFASPQN